MSETIVRVRRDTSHLPPPSMERQGWARYPGIDRTGPDAFDVTHLDRWFHPTQREGGLVIGYAVHTALVQYELLPRCLGLYDLEAIREKGEAFFLKYFHSSPVFGWKTRVLDEYRHPRVSCLVPNRKNAGKLAIKWCLLSQYVRHDVPIWMFPEIGGKEAS